MIRLNRDEKSTKIAGILRESRDVFNLTLHGRIYKVMTLETWLKIHTNDCKLWQPPPKPYKLLIFFTISVIFVGKHSDFRISSFQVVYAWRILQFNWKNEIYLKGFTWFFRLHEEFRMIIFHGNRSRHRIFPPRDNLGGFVYWNTSLTNCCLGLRITTWNGLQLVKSREYFTYSTVLKVQ